MARGTWGPSGDEEPYRVRISWESGTNVCQTGFKLRDKGITYATAQGVANHVQEWVTSDFRTLLGTQQRVLGVDVVNMVTLEGGSTSPANEYGTVAIGGNATPDYMCCTATLKGPLRARYGQGRMFWPVVHESTTDWNVLGASGITLLQGVIDSLVERYVGNLITGLVLVNTHGIIPPKGATPTTPARPEVPASWYDVESVRLNTKITFLRSRKAGVGS